MVYDFNVGKGLRPECKASGFPELDDWRLFGPEGYVAHNAEEKVNWLLRNEQIDADVIIGCDTVVAFEGRVLEKPANLREAKEMVMSYSGKSIDIFSGIVLLLCEVICLLL